LVAVILGLLISPLFARLLPFGLEAQVAAFILRADRWNAGAALMQAQSPEAWRALMDASKLTSDNSAALEGCLRSGGEGEERAAMHDRRSGA
jgi:hypothetical protein